MGMQTGRTKLENSMKELLLYWERTNEVWDDAASQDFEVRHLLPLEPKIRTAVSAMERMAALLHQARNDCRGTDPF
ncbi:MAG: hypothetical protein KDA25_09465 [Phycisphaerales bacterium]|nr:hypothetical protein [Phycisphaerales bacterium]